MAASEAEIAAKKLRDKDKRLRKCYGWTLAMRNALFVAQDGKCAGCGRPENPDYPLNLDHEHFLTDSFRSPDAAQKWTAVARFKDGRSFTELGSTKAAAIAAVKNKALPESVRGLLCPGRYRGCNRLLGRIDDIPLLEAFLRYLKNPPAKQILHSMKVLDKSTNLC
jgi:Recombination endonuclease VII